MSAPDRLQALESQDVITGLDFVSVHPGQTELDLFFLTPPLGLAAPLSDLQVAQVRIVGEPSAPPVEVVAIGWVVEEGRDALHVETAAPGGFSPYRISVDDPRIDPYWNGIAFSFKAACPSDLDCAPAPQACPVEAEVDHPTPTLARDFWSFRRALLELASQRYPDWKDRLEADVGVMLVEVMAALGDELAYYQDRVAREATLETASERRSLAKHARLVDHTVHEGLGATTWLDVQVDEAFSTPQLLPAGTGVSARGDLGREVPFEVGSGLRDTSSYEVSASRNSLVPHLWDEGATCLGVGATAMHLKGHHAANLPLDDEPPGEARGRWVLLRADPPDPALPERRWLVRLVEVEDGEDPLAADPVTGTAVTRVRWEPAQALPFEMDLELLTLHGNLVPATAGRRKALCFSIGAAPGAGVPEAVERTGPSGTTAYLFTLPDPEGPRRGGPHPDGEGLVWLGAEPRRARPELLLEEGTVVGGAFQPARSWAFRRSLLGVESSQPTDRHFTLEAGTWGRAVGYHRPTGEVVHRDYLSGRGATIRFGDGELGRVPAEGAVFRATYRVGVGEAGNLSAGSIRHLAAPASLAFIASISNPLAASGGLEPEPLREVKTLAPEEFRSLTFRAVRPEDYAEAAERLPSVQRAGATLRWTGSWLSVLLSADPAGEAALDEATRLEVEEQVDRFRQTGREVMVREPRYADIDLLLTLCLQPWAYRGQVIEAVREVLLGRAGPRPRRGFFHPDRFTFGTPLDRSALEAAIHEVPGVRAVRALALRRRGLFAFRPFLEAAYRPAPHEVIRLEGDRAHPGRGSLRVVTEGGL